MANEFISELIEIIEANLQLGRSQLEIERKLRVLNASDEQIAEALALVKAKSKGTDGVTVITDDTPREDWYLGPSTAPTSHWSLLTDVLRGKPVRPWTDEMVQNLNYASSEVVANLANPKSDKPQTTKGLVLGYVQSGKTANFSAVIAKAVDAGYKLVIVLGGVHNILRKQTQARLEVEIIAPKREACFPLTSDEVNGDFQKKQPIPPNSILSQSGAFTLAVIKKNSPVLRNFVAWLEKASPEFLANCPTLIIDDESDQASVNTKDPDEDPTAINNHIRNLISKFKVVSYVGYTATPFANILIDADVKEDLFPKDFIVTLDKPQGYVGTEELFGRDVVDPSDSKTGMPVIRNIPEAIEDDEVIGTSLEMALYSFVLGGTSRLCRGQWDDHISMLVHTSHLTAEHQTIFENVSSWIQQLKLMREDEDSKLNSKLKKLWEEDFVPTSKEWPGAKEVSFDLIWKNSKRFISELSVIMENSKSLERLNYDDGKFWGIIIGGNTLSRGLTIEGLTTSYFDRSSSGYDTLLQMGRWFGYRPNYVDLTRIFVTEDLESQFYHLATVELEMRHEIKAMAANGERPIDVAINIRTHPNMTVTSRSKMRSARNSALTYSSAKSSAMFVNNKNLSILNQNIEVVKGLLSKIETYGSQRTLIPFEDFKESLLFRGVKSESILQFIDQMNFSSANINFIPRALKDYISDLNNSEELQDWSVAVISTKTGQEFDLGVGNKIRMVDRTFVKKNRSDADPEARWIKVVTSPRDELVDLFDVLPPVRRTKELFEGEEKLTEVIIRRRNRPKERGLLLLYVINPNIEMTDDEYRTLLNDNKPNEPVRSTAPIVGVALVFPQTKNVSRAYRFIANSSIR
jgi:hypothetical protein